jgi:ELWxxDGT repeat protein
MMLKDLLPGIDGSNPNELKAFDGVLYFSAYTPAAGFEVWSSDGTVENTTMLVDVLPGAQYSNPSHFVKLDDHLVFYGLTTQSGFQLWSYTFDDPDENVTGIEESNIFSIYPNPSNGLFRMKHSGVQSNGSVEIFSPDGRRIGKMNYDGEDTMIDITHQPPGMYVIKIIDGQNCTTTKVNKF